MSKDTHTQASGDSMVNLGYSGEQEKRMKAHLWNERAGKSESKVKCFFKRNRERERERKERRERRFHGKAQETHIKGRETKSA